MGLTHGEDGYHAVSNNATELNCMRAPDSGVDSWGTSNRAVVEWTYLP